MWMTDQSKNTFAIYLDVTDNIPSLKWTRTPSKVSKMPLLPRGVVGPKPPLGCVDRCLDPS